MKSENATAPPRAVLIAGPTASGKSALALDLAREFGGVIVNADSIQVYAELRIITNRPTPEEESTVPHSLYGFRPASQPYSAALWLSDVSIALGNAKTGGRLPIIVGGTGLYFKVLTEGLSAIPEIPLVIRERYRHAAKTEGVEKLYGELGRLDPLTASRLRPSDPQRIVRALEVFAATGRPLAEWQAQKQPPLLPLTEAYPIALTLERAELYKRCDQRFDAIMRDGALDEARQFARLGLDSSLPAARAVGLPPLLRYCRGELGFEDAVALAKTNTRNYAKRQLTWISGNFSAWNHADTQFIERTKKEINIYLQRT